MIEVPIPEINVEDLVIAMPLINREHGGSVSKAKCPMEDPG